MHMLQSSSPSYILMASIDECVRGMDECREEIMDTYVECLQQARERLKQLKNIKLIEAEHYDRSKIVLSVKNLKNTNGEVLNGKRFQEMLRSYHLEMEMASGSYVIAMTGPGDTQEGMDRLVQAVMEIDKNILCEELSGNDEDHTIKNISYEMIPLEQAYSSFEAGRMEGESVKWNEASGRISLEYVYLYPPGIPMIVPWVEKLAFVPKWADQCPTCSIITNFSHGVKPFFQKTENFFISAGGSVVSPAFLCISHNGFDISTRICGNLLPQTECFKEKT